MLGMARHLLQSRGEPQPCSVDQVVLLPGESRPARGGGAVYSPLQLHLFASTPDGLQETGTEAVRAWLRVHLPSLDPQRHLRLHWHRREAMAAPEEAMGFGHAPLSPVESAVLRAEQVLNSAATRSELPALGPDVTVTGEADGERLRLHLRCTLVDAAVTGDAAARAALEAAAVRVADAVPAEIATVNEGLPPEQALTAPAHAARRPAACTCPSAPARSTSPAAAWSATACARTR